MKLVLSTMHNAILIISVLDMSICEKHYLPIKSMKKFLQELIFNISQRY